MMAGMICCRWNRLRSFHISLQLLLYLTPTTTPGGWRLSRSTSDFKLYTFSTIWSKSWNKNPGEDLFGPRFPTCQCGGLRYVFPCWFRLLTALNFLCFEKWVELIHFVHYMNIGEIRATRNLEEADRRWPVGDRHRWLGHDGWSQRSLLRHDWPTYAWWVIDKYLQMSGYQYEKVWLV